MNGSNLKKAELDIIEIRSVYFSKSPDWERSKYAPRAYDGLVLFLEGEVDYFFGNRHYIAKRGDILCFPGNISYSGKKISDGDVSFIVCDFSCKTEKEYEGLSLPVVSASSDFEMYFEKFSRLLKLHRENKISSGLRLLSLLYELIASVMEDSSVISSSDTADRIIEYIGNNLADPELSVSSMCSQFFVSESQLRRKIIAFTGMTPNRYITALRLDLAKNELCYTGKSVKEISRECGFSSQYYFTKCFKSHFSLSPKAWRERIKSHGGGL